MFIFQLVLFIFFMLTGLTQSWAVRAGNQGSHSVPLSSETRMKHLDISVALLVTCKRHDHHTARFGDYVHTFSSFLTATHRFRIQKLQVFDCWAGQVPTFDDVANVDLIIITGSVHSVNEELPWMVDIKKIIVDERRKAWVFGVCFGHQLACAAYGSQVNRCGWELGAVQIRVEGVVPHSEMTVLHSHTEQVYCAPSGFTVWCSGDQCPVQGTLCKRRRVFTVQFHPEYTIEHYLGTAEYRPALTDEQKERVRQAQLDHLEIVEALFNLMAPSS